MIYMYISCLCLKHELIFFFTSVEDFRRSGIPKGIRTPVTAVKGRCPRPLDDRDTKTIKQSLTACLCNPTTYKVHPTTFIFLTILVLLLTLLNNIGGAMRDRTADLFAASEALSQLSYSPT